MTTAVPLRVWAPEAEAVTCVTDAGPFPLVRQDGDPREHHWVGELPAGTDYRLTVTTRDAATGELVEEGPFPDPRSRWQPQGIHGPSRAFDPEFAWTDADWKGTAGLGQVWYELHVGTFTPEGTLDAAIERLPYLADLGVDVVELMPVPPFPGERGWGYDGVSLFAVHEAYGGPRALQRFVDAAHALGLGVALDVVYNHMGPDGNYTHPFGPYFTDAHETPWGQAPNLDDTLSEGMRSFIIDNARQWFADFHVDALRLDAVHALVDDSDKHILAELAEKKTVWEQELDRPLLLIAESDLNDAKLLEPASKGGYGLDGQWDDDFHHALHSYLSGETFGYYVDFGSAETLADVYQNVFLHRGNYSTFRGQNWGRPVPEDMARDRFFAFTQNHDQVGNRALGDRPEHALPPSLTLAGAALLLFSPFTPMLFQGQEFAATAPFQFFTDHQGDLGKAVSRGRLEEFATHGWYELYGDDFQVPNPQIEQTFLQSKLDWEELDQPEHQEILASYKKLISLRHLIQGDSFVATDYDQRGFADWFRLTRSRVEVIVNQGPERSFRTGEAGAGSGAAAGQILWSWGPVRLDDAGHVTLGPESVAVLRR